MIPSPHDYEKLTRAISQGIVNAVMALAIFYGIGLIIALAVSFFMSDYDATDDQMNGVRSNMALYTDYGTGCQYLSSKQGGLTPRLDEDGKHICRK